MNTYVDIDSRELVIFINKLEKMRRSALPVAIRGTLNKAAFDVKQRTMIESSEAHFIKRKPNFFKANSRVQMASGFAVSSMRSVVGFTSAGANNYTNFAVQELRQQEYGGAIGHRSFIPLDTARTGENPAGLVRPGQRLSEIKGIQDSNLGPGNTEKEKFVRAAIRAGRGGFVLGNTPKQMLHRVMGLKRVKGRITRVKTRPLYSFSRGREVNIQATGFMREATRRTAASIPRFFVNEANRQFARL